MTQKENHLLFDILNDAINAAKKQTEVSHTAKTAIEQRMFRTSMFYQEGVVDGIMLAIRALVEAEQTENLVGEVHFSLEKRGEEQ